MLAFIIRRFVQSIAVLLLMSLLVFVGVYAIGNPIDILISPDADQIERARVIAAFGLDQPFWIQYLLFIKMHWPATWGARSCMPHRPSV